MLWYMYLNQYNANYYIRIKRGMRLDRIRTEYQWVLVRDRN